MKRAIAIFCLLSLVTVGVAGAWWLLGRNAGWESSLRDWIRAAGTKLGLVAEGERAGLALSGFVEADEVSVNTEVAGRIAAIHAGEGDKVIQGQDLVELDGSLLEAQIAVAAADLTVAEAALARVKAGPRLETLDRARAVVDQARIAQEAARVAWEDAQAMVDDPQELVLEVVAAKAQLGVLDHQVQQAEALANSAQAARDYADEAARLISELLPQDGSGPPLGLTTPWDLVDRLRLEQAQAAYLSWQAWSGLDQSQAARDGAESYLGALTLQVANPLTLRAQADAAQAEYEVAQAARAVAQAQLDGLRLGSTPQQIAAVEAQLEVSRAALAVLQSQARKLVLTAPISGLVLTKSAHVGEVAIPGTALLTIADLDDLTLTVYVPEDRLGQVQLGLPVTITVDAYPERIFEGTIISIASEAEFTPKSIQAEDQRISMVFAVKARLPNPDHALKPGMLADAALSGGSR